MYKDYTEVKDNIDSLKWGKVEKVNKTMSRRRLINNGAKGYSYKYYMNSDPNTYVVMSAGRSEYTIYSAVIDAVAFGVKDGKTTKDVRYLNDSYIHQENYFKDPIFDKIGNVAIKDFKLSYKRKIDKSKSGSLENYNKTLNKEFIGKLQPIIEKAAKQRGYAVSQFRITRGPAGAIFPTIRFYLGNLPVVIDHSLSKRDGKKYFGYMEVEEPENNRDYRYFKATDKVVQELTKIVNDTCRERTSNLMKDPDGINLRINRKAQDEKEGMSALKGTTSRLQYEEYVPTYFNY